LDFSCWHTLLRNDAQNRAGSAPVTQGAVTLKAYQVNCGERTIFSVSDREHGRRRLRQFGRLEKALGWAATRAKELDRRKKPFRDPLQR
jgi:hypothetical protein